MGYVTKTANAPQQNLADPQLFVEMFPILTDALPPLTAYSLQVDPDGDAQLIGGKLAYQFRLLMPGSWLWLDQHLLTDNPPGTMDIIMALDHLREQQPAIFAPLEALEEDYDWKPSPTRYADFVVRGPMSELDALLRLALAESGSPRLTSARVEREHHLDTWNVAGTSAVSLSVATRIVYENDLGAYAAAKITTKTRSELIGLSVADRTSNLYGDIVEIAGNLGKNRKRLLALTQRQKMIDILTYAPNDEPVVRVQVKGRRTLYDYTASALHILIRPQDSERFSMDARQVTNALKMPPPTRAAMVRSLSAKIKEHGIIGNAYSMQNALERFSSGDPKPDLRYGKGKVKRYDAAKIGFDACIGGDYARLTQFQTEPIRAAIVNPLNEKIDDFIEAMARKLKREFNFQIDMARERKVKSISAENLNSAIKVLEKEAPHIILIFMPDEQSSRVNSGGATPKSAADAGENLSDYFRSLALARGLPCEIISRATLDDPDAMGRVIVSMLGKTGNLPYILDEPLDYTDLVAGIDVIHAEKPNPDESINVTFTARIYRNDGALLRYVAHCQPIDPGEPIPLAVMSALFPINDFGKQRVLLHHRGKLSAELKTLLAAWEKASKIKFSPVEIIPGDGDLPHLYAFVRGKVNAARPGSAFHLNDKEALLVTNAAEPLYLRVVNDLTTAQAIESLQLFTLLHYGAVHLPELPVTLYRGDELAGHIAKGMLPGGDYSVVPFWL